MIAFISQFAAEIIWLEWAEGYYNLSPFKFINKHLKFLLLFTPPHLKQLELPRDLKALGQDGPPATFPVLTVKSGSRYLCCSFSQDSLLAGCSKTRPGLFRTILSLGVQKYKLCDSGFLSKFLSKLQG